MIVSLSKALPSNEPKVENNDFISVTFVWTNFDDGRFNIRQTIFSNVFRLVKETSAKHSLILLSLSDVYHTARAVWNQIIYAHNILYMGIIPTLCIVNANTQIPPKSRRGALNKKCVS